MRTFTPDTGFAQGKLVGGPCEGCEAVLEPNGKYYYIESFLFEGGKFLTKEKIENVNPRGGTNGIIRLKK